MTAPIAESNAEIKATKELFAMAVKTDDDLDHLLAKHNYWKTLRVCAWIMQFANNARAERMTRAKRPLTTDKIEKQKHFWLLLTEEQSCIARVPWETARGLSHIHPRRHDFRKEIICRTHLQSHSSRGSGAYYG